MSRKKQTNTLIYCALKCDTVTPVYLLALAKWRLQWESGQQFWRLEEEAAGPSLTGQKPQSPVGPSPALKTCTQRPVTDETHWLQWSLSLCFTDVCSDLASSRRAFWRYCSSGLVGSQSCSSKYDAILVLPAFVSLLHQGTCRCIELYRQKWVIFCWTSGWWWHAFPFPSFWRVYAGTLHSFFLYLNQDLALLIEVFQSCDPQWVKISTLSGDHTHSRCCNMKVSFILH